MKSYLVTYYDGNGYKCEWLQSTDPAATAPQSWNLPETCDIISVIVGANLVQAIYVEGEKKEQI